MTKDEIVTKADVAELRERTDFAANGISEQIRALHTEIDGLPDIAMMNLEHHKRQREWLDRQEARENAGAPVKSGKFDEARADADQWG
jgi:hypothetical protein